MLLSLSIKNFALISELYIELKEGLNIITGETGAGKSIVIDSISFITGARFNKEIVKKGTDMASVSAMFDLSDMQREKIEEFGFTLEDNVVSISRTISSAGKSVCRFNGEIITLTLLKQIAQNILEIHGQHENQIIFDSNNHVLFLDDFAKNEKELNAFQEKFFEFKEFRKKILDEKLDSKSLNFKIESLKAEIQEIADLKWKKGQEQALIEKINEYDNYEKIATSLSEVYSTVYKSDYSLQNSIKNALASLDSIRGLNPKFEEIYSRLETIGYEVEDISNEVRDVKNESDYDPNKLDLMQSKLFAFNKVKKKYGLNEDELVDYVESKQKELDELEYNLANSEELKNKLKEMFITAKKCAEELSTTRKEKAVMLCKEVENHLHDLGMKNARFDVSIEPKDMSSKGIDNVEFMFCANAGQDLKPLTKVASGGEISRLMLSMKNIDLNSSLVDTMIFDEIDTGISGKVAQAVANKLANISKDNQVLCVTHLPQVAAMSDNHIFVYKTETENETVVSIKELNIDEKLIEVARMFSGEDVSDTGINHAKELVESCESYKKSL